MDGVDRQDRSARLLAVAHAVEVVVKKVYVFLRETAFHTVPTLYLMDAVTVNVEMKVDLVVPALPHAATSVLAERPAAQLRRLGDIHDVRVHDPVQVHHSVDAGFLQNTESTQLNFIYKAL